MKIRYVAWIWSLILLLITGCGGKQSKQTDSDQAGDEQQEAAGEIPDESKPEVIEAQKQIRSWLREDLNKKISQIGKDLGKNIGAKLVSNEAVTAELKKLTAGVLKDPAVKPRLKEIEDRATAGFGKKLTLGWKALQAGGIDEFKSKVAGNAQRVAVDVLTVHLKENIFKDERFSAFMKDVSPILKVQGQVAALTMQENLSPRVTTKIMSLALRITSAKGDPNMADKVAKWVDNCEGDEDKHIEKMIAEISALPSLEESLAALAIEVFGHERTKKELVQMVDGMLSDPAMDKALEKVYEAAAFEKGDEEIKKAMDAVIAIETLNNELFAALNRIASAEGAGPMIGRHLKKVGEDKVLARIVEDFVLNLLETCGDPASVQ